MEIRNIAIIAHVDHGKTTLVGQLLRQSGTFRANQQVAERALDSNELERERGITILAKCTSVEWRAKDHAVRINIVDTPGHADFGGEVERILSMVDGVLVLVNAAEGPLPQTKFVVGKALRRGLKPIVVINKIDRPDARPEAVHNEIFDLFALLDANEAQLDFPTLFASGREGWAVKELNGPRRDLSPLFDLIVAHVRPPEADQNAPFSMLATTLSVNASPLAGRDGGKVTSRIIAERLHREAEGNVAFKVQENAARDAVEVSGRGELQFGVLIETMRREGFELSISRPRVLFKTDPKSGQRQEPIEEAIIDVDQEFAGVVVDKMSRRKAELQEMRPSGGGKLRLSFLVPTRGLIGYHGEFLTDTRGSGVMSRLFHGYAPYKGSIEGRRNGVLISNAPGAAVAYALWNLEDRGAMFVSPGDAIYPGMIIGAHSRDNDLDV